MAWWMVWCEQKTEHWTTPHLACLALVFGFLWWVARIAIGVDSGEELRGCLVAVMGY